MMHIKMMYMPGLPSSKLLYILSFMSERIVFFSFWDAFPKIEPYIRMKNIAQVKLLIAEVTTPAIHGDL